MKKNYLNFFGRHLIHLSEDELDSENNFKKHYLKNTILTPISVWFYLTVEYFDTSNFDSYFHQ